MSSHAGRQCRGEEATGVALRKCCEGVSLDAQLLAEAMAEEFATSLPTDSAGWLEAAERIAEQVGPAKD